MYIYVYIYIYIILQYKCALATHVSCQLPAGVGVAMGTADTHIGIMCQPAPPVEPLQSSAHNVYTHAHTYTHAYWPP